MQIHNKVLGGALLVAGTTIGAGVLGLPLVTGLAGLWPSICLLLIYWCYMTFTAFLMLEVNLCIGGNINLITMAKHTLGKAGEIVSWVVYLFLLYSLTTAYLAVGGPVLVDFVYATTKVALPSWAGSLPLLFIFGFFVYEGTKYVDFVNRIFMFGLIIAYGAMVFLLVPHIDRSYFHYADWNNPLLAVSLVATSFGFHIIIPTLTTYMHHNTQKLVKALLIGTFIPVVVYVIWEIVTLGVIPISGENGLLEGYKQDINTARLLSRIMGDSWVALAAQFFSFFAIITSFLGVTLSLSDFLADGLRVKKTHLGRMILFTLTFLPPLVIILTYPRVFLTALEFAGAFGVVILLGLLPALMAWSARYRKKMKAPFTTPGGKIALLAAIIFSLAVMGIEIGNKTGYIEWIILKG
ncbi:MAG: Tyrosine-specific transport protein [Chlamydiae bacterium]|nr:Tyrosine-specific transport protein [Chlamydiota bacterium]